MDTALTKIPQGFLHSFLRLACTHLLYLATQLGLAHFLDGVPGGVRWTFRRHTFCPQHVNQPVSPIIQGGGSKLHCHTFALPLNTHTSTRRSEPRRAELGTWLQNPHNTQAKTIGTHPTIHQNT